MASRGAAQVVNPETTAFIAADAWFVLIAAIGGLLTGIAGYLLLVRRHGAPAKGIESIMVEINKKLFMDTKTFRRTEGFARLKADLDRLLKTLAGEAAKRSRGGSTQTR